MEKIDNVVHGNEFLIHLICADPEEKDSIVNDLLRDEHFGATLLSKKLFKDENKVAYRIKISPAGLILFKKKFDETIVYDSLELFEFKEW